MKSLDFVRHFKVALPFVPLTISTFFSEGLLHHALTSIGIFFIVYTINIPKLFFNVNKIQINSLLSLSASIVYITITHPTSSWYYFYSSASLVLLFICGLLLYKDFDTFADSYCKRKIDRMSKRSKNCWERNIIIFGSIILLLFFTYFGFFILTIITLTLYYVYIPLFLVLIIYSFVRILLDRSKKSGYEMLVDTIENADNFEKDFLENFVQQFLTIKGILYSYIFIFSSGYAAVGATFAISLAISALLPNEKFLNSVANFFPNSNPMFYVLFGLFIVIYGLALLTIYFYPLYFTWKIMKLNMLRIRRRRSLVFRNEHVHILPLSGFSLTLFFVVYDLDWLIFQFSPLISRIIFLLTPMINIVIIGWLLKNKKSEKLTLKTEEEGAIILLVTILTSMVIYSIFPSTKLADEILIAEIFVSSVFAILLFSSLFAQFIFTKNPIKNIKIKNRWKEEI